MVGGRFIASATDGAYATDYEGNFWCEHLSGGLFLAHVQNLWLFFTFWAVDIWPTHGDGPGVDGYSCEQIYGGELGEDYYSRYGFTSGEVF